MARAGIHSSDIETCGLSYSALLELWLGPCNSSVFDSTEQLRDAWIRGRDVAMRLWGSHGRRPMAWWCFEAPGLGLRWPGYDAETRYLLETNTLSEAERAELPRELIQRWTAAARRRARARGAAPEKAQGFS
jgi:hypothetical protein